MTKYFTKEGLDKLKEELRFLKNEKMKDISRRIKEAASFGDLKENAAYTEAKEEQAFTQGRIVELEDKIREAEIIEKNETDEISIGSTAFITSDDEEVFYTLVDPAEADPIDNKISFSSPLGKELMGKKKGDKVELFFDEDKVIYTIKEIR